MSFDSNLQKTARISGKYKEVLSGLDKCVFCDLREKYVIKEIDGVVLTVALFPYINGHIMVIPRRHIEFLSEMTEMEWLATKKLIEQGVALLRQKLDIRGVNVIYRESESCAESGKTVAHAHINLIPFNRKLFKYEYQEITIEPIALAKLLRIVETPHVASQMS